MNSIEVDAFAVSRPPFARLVLVAMVSMASTALMAEVFYDPKEYSSDTWPPTTISGLDNAHFQVDSVTKPAIKVGNLNFYLKGAQIINAGSGGGVLFTTWSNKKLVIEESQITVGGNGGFGIKVDGGRYAGGGVEASEVEVTMTGDDAKGLFVQTGILDFSGSVTTTGSGSVGAEVMAGSVMDFSGNLTANGADSIAASVHDNGTASFDRSTIVTKADNSTALLLRSNGNVILSNSSVTTEGAGSHGVSASNGFDLQVKDSTIATSGIASHGLLLSSGGAASISTSEISTVGDQSHGISVTSAHVEIQNSSVVTSGTGAAALQVDRGGQVEVGSSILSGLQGPVVQFVESQQSWGESRVEVFDTQVAGGAAVVQAQAASDGVFNASNSDIRGDSVGFQVENSARLQSNLSGSTMDLGDKGLLASVNGDGRLSLIGQDSQFRGDTLLVEASQGVLNIELHDSSWQMNSSSSLTHLELDNSLVSFSADGYHVLTLSGDLSGAGSFLMHTDLMGRQGDLLLVEGTVAGSHTLIIEDSGHEAAGESLQVVGSGGGDGAFSLYGSHIDAGAYRYTLEKEGTDWLLVSAEKGEPTDPEAPEQPDPGAPGEPDPEGPEEPSPEPEEPGKPGGESGGKQPDIISKGSNVALGMQSAAANLYYAELGTLVQRLGELRLGHDQGGVWMRAIGKDLRMGKHYGRAYQQKHEGVEVGVDKAIPVEAGRLFLGGMFGAGESRLHFGESSRGQLDSQSIGLYATYLRDDGWYVDNVVKFNHMDGKVKTPTNLGTPVKGDYSANAFGVSVEVGKQYNFKDGWFVEPQAQLSATRLEGPTYRSSNDLKVRGADTDSLLGRLGVRAGRDIALDSGMRLQGYVTASYIDEFAGDTHVKVNGHKLNNALPGARGELGLGSSLQLSEKQKVSLQVDYANGEHMEQPWAVSLGYRYLW
ncbi:autotransporter outer membrane beta-barrel domain-containing protein [Pseudomonas sp. BBP2017]|uniref:autotransporter family protein n=1 Tax=Pseudomonas sp. BBP2017 TaxID=2109731 RepID=UPI001304CA40|nr:autotransporter outer membrane beta-barrel domain-containing protein [Pseudomonas sp. BBP2017]